MQQASEWDQWVETAFNNIDTDQSGSLDAQELRDFLCDPDGACMTPAAGTTLHAITARIFPQQELACQCQMLCRAVEEAMTGIPHGAGEPGPSLTLEDFKEMLHQAGPENLAIFADRTVTA